MPLLMLARVQLYRYEYSCNLYIVPVCDTLIPVPVPAPAVPASYLCARRSHERNTESGCLSKLVLGRVAAFVAVGALGCRSGHEHLERAC